MVEENASLDFQALFRPRLHLEPCEEANERADQEQESTTSLVKVLSIDTIDRTTRTA